MPEIDTFSLPFKQYPQHMPEARLVDPSDIGDVSEIMDIVRRLSYEDFKQTIMTRGESRGVHHHDEAHTPAEERPKRIKPRTYLIEGKALAHGKEAEIVTNEGQTKVIVRALNESGEAETGLIGIIEERAYDSSPTFPPNRYIKIRRNADPTYLLFNADSKLPTKDDEYLLSIDATEITVLKAAFVNFSKRVTTSANTAKAETREKLDKIEEQQRLNAIANREVEAKAALVIAQTALKPLIDK